MVTDALEILHPARDREHGLAFRLARCGSAVRSHPQDRLERATVEPGSPAPTTATQTGETIALRIWSCRAFWMGMRWMRMPQREERARLASFV